MSEPFLGEIVMFAGNFAPRGWAFCNGQLLSVQQNSALFAILGTTYGGNGQSTFALPDLRGRVPTGIGQGPGTDNVNLGQVSGSPSTTLNINQLPVHAPAATFSGTLSNATATVPVGTSAANPIVEPTANGTTYLTAATASLGRDSVPINGLYTNAAPASPAHLGGVAVTGAVTGTVTVGQVGGSQPFSVVQPYLGVSFIIAVEGIFPSRN